MLYNTGLDLILVKLSKGKAKTIRREGLLRLSNTVFDEATFSYILGFYFPFCLMAIRLFF